ncbi:MAG: DUF3017 domain-containing protein [Candidatus Nanopelagicales bacterium]
MSGMAEVHRLPSRRRRWWTQWPIAVVLVGVAVSLTIVALDHFRIGSLMLGASLVLAFVLRLALPSDRVGLLAVRSKSVDLVVLGTLAAALVVFALWVPPPA